MFCAVLCAFLSIVSAESFAVTFAITPSISSALFNVTVPQQQMLENYWFALGFRDTGDRRTMTNSDYVFVHIEDNRCIVEDRWSVASGDGEPKNDDYFGGVDDYYGISTVDQYGVSCLFRRKFYTGDKFDYELKDEPLLLMYGVGKVVDGKFQVHHKSIKSTEANLVGSFNEVTWSYSEDSAKSKSSQVLSWKVFWHGIFMTIAFVAIMIPFSGLARFMKNAWPRWFFVHWKGQVAAIVFATIGLLLVFAHLNWSFRQHKHSIYGAVVVFGILPLQALLGYLSNKMWFEGKPPAVFPDKLHWINGYALMISSVIVIGLGIEWYIQLLPLYLSSKGIKTNVASGGVWAVFGLLCASILIGFVLMEAFVGQVHEHERDEVPTRAGSRDDLEEIGEEVVLIQKPTPPMVWSLSATKKFFIGWWSFVIGFTLILAIVLGTA